jgi:hypothetical protein
MRKNLFILKARGTDAISQEVEFYIGEDLAVRPLKASLEHAHRENTR